MKNLVIGVVSGAALLFLLGWMFGIIGKGSDNKIAYNSSSASRSGLSESDIDAIASKIQDSMPDCVKICDKPRSIVKEVKKKVEPKKTVACEETNAYKQCVAEMQSDWNFACRKQDNGMEKISTNVSTNDKTLGNTRIENKSVAITINKKDEIDCSKPKESYFKKCREKVCHK